jgi:hypothetical protein
MNHPCRDCLEIAEIISAEVEVFQIKLDENIGSIISVPVLSQSVLSMLVDTANSLLHLLLDSPPSLLASSSNIHELNTSLPALHAK